MSAKTTSCGVIVTDGERLLLGHATRSPRWDIPKGEAEPGESFAAAARRELFEETGLDAPEAELKPLGVFAYRRGKDLALYAWALILLVNFITTRVIKVAERRARLLYCPRRGWRTGRSGRCQSSRPVRPPIASSRSARTLLRQATDAAFPNSRDTPPT